MPTYPHLVNLNGNLLCAVDVETTGRVAGWHEIIQIAILPLGSDLNPLEGVPPFYRVIRPNYPERAEKEGMMVNGLNLEALVLTAPSQFDIAERLDEWFNRLELPFQRRLEPLAFNWAYERGFLLDWLGMEDLDHYFHFHPRDPMRIATFLNDFACFSGGQPPFRRMGLGDVCSRLGVINENPHDALADCVATAEVYKRLLQVVAGTYSIQSDEGSSDNH